MNFSDLESCTKQLTRLEERRRLALSINKVGIWEWDLKTGFLYWDDNMFKIYEIAKSEFNNTCEDWSKRLHPADLEVCEHKIKECIERDEPYVFRFRVNYPDGRQGIVAGFGGCVKDNNGVPEKILGVNVLESVLCPEHCERTLTDPCSFCPSRTPSFLTA